MKTQSPGLRELEIRRKLIITYFSKSLGGTTKHICKLINAQERKFFKIIQSFLLYTYLHKEALGGWSVGALNSSTHKVGSQFRESRSYKYKMPQLSPYFFLPKPIHKSMYLIPFSKDMPLLSNIREISQQARISL